MSAASIIHVRSAQDEDFLAIAALTNSFILHTPIHFGTEPVTSEELREQWIATRTRYPFLVATIQGAFAGYAKASVWRSRPAYAWNCESGIYLEEQARGRGVGRALYQVLFAELSRQGFHAVIAGITLPNPASVRLHVSMGFTHVGTFDEAGWKMEAWHGVGFWRLALAAPGAAPRPLLDTRDVATDIRA
jgi:phosphinothricin acetyltransferase